MSQLYAKILRRFLTVSFEDLRPFMLRLEGTASPASGHLQNIARTFVQSYQASLDEDDLAELASRLNAVEAELRGFAFEGAAMGLALLDHLTLRRGRVRSFLEGPAAAHAPLVHVGVGWAFAALPWLRRRIEKELVRYEPLYSWLILDGYGFYEGLFHSERCVRRHQVPKWLARYSSHIFHQGVGRSLWFIDGGDAARIKATIAAFPQNQQADLWSGVGVACAYAGGMDKRTLEVLLEGAGKYVSYLAQGAALAAKVRRQAGNPARRTDEACRIICGLSAEEAAGLADELLKRLPANDDRPAYEIWRQRLQLQFVCERGRV